MIEEAQIRGLCPPEFAPVREAFAANFAEGKEIGAAFALAVDGEVVVDLTGGFADRARQRPWTNETLAPIFSTTKALVSLLVAKAAGEGALRYEQPVVELWPEFGQSGKAGLTVEQVLSHQAGLVGFAEAIDPELWYDWDAVCARLAAAEPLWRPGTASGYHPATFGYLAGEILRRATGRTPGQALWEIAGPLGLDVWIGLPEPEHHRVAEVAKPPGPALIGELTPVKRAAFYTTWAAPPHGQSARWRQTELPSANGHATARDLARLMAPLACDGLLDGRRLLAPGAAETASRARICGEDLVLPYDLCWGAGFLRNDPVKVYGPGEQSFGHSGWGGSCVFADPERRLSGAYVMNKQSVHLIGDPRPMRIIEAAYACL
ncbi:MAG TPA: serine hydrolase domain-containing protein [Caulobacteraceae bacterium]|jgi:CubicO group peptidase (beta-lactamase class C family)